MNSRRADNRADALAVSTWQLLERAELLLAEAGVLIRRAKRYSPPDLPAAPEDAPGRRPAARSGPNGPGPA